MEEVLLDLEKDLSNFQLTINKKDKTIGEYIRLLKLRKFECQKSFNLNKIIKNTRKNRKRKKIRAKKENIKKKKTNIETESEELEPEQSEQGPKPTIYRKIKKIKQKTIKSTPNPPKKKFRNFLNT